MHGVAGHHRAAAGEGAGAPVELVGIAGDDIDFIDPHTHLVGDDLREAGVVALALRADAGDQAHAAAGLHLHLGAFVGADAGAFDVEHQPQADAAAGGAVGRLSGGEEFVIADHGFQLVQHRFVVTAVVTETREVLVDDLPVKRKGVRRDEVAAADLGAVDAEFPRGDVEQALDHEYAVLAAGAAIGGHGGLVGEDDAKAAVVVGNVVGAQQGALAVERYGQAVGITGAGVAQEVVLHAEDAAVATQCDFGVVDLLALVGGGGEVLGAVFYPLDWRVEAHGSPGHQQFLGVVRHDLGAEGAADEGGDHAHLPFGETQHGGDHVADHHRGLGGVPHGQAQGLGVPLRDRATGFHRHRGTVVVAEAALDDGVGGARGGGVVALGLAHLGRDVVGQVGMYLGRGGCGGFFEVRGYRLRVPVDLDVAQCVLGDVAALRDHDRHRFSDMAHNVLPQRGLGTLVEHRALHRRRRYRQRAGAQQRPEIVGGIHRDHAGPRQRSRGIDRQDARMRIGATQQSRVQHTGQLHIVYEQRAAGQEALVFVAGDRLAEIAGAHAGLAPIAAMRSAASTTAATIFW